MAKINKNILVIGGAGFIGSHLTERLVSSKYNVCVFDNLSNTSKIYNSKLCKQVYGDISNLKDISDCVKEFKPDILINLAAYHYIPNCIKDPERTIRVNVTGTKNSLEAIRKFSPNTKFIITSSAAVYKPDTKKHTEKSPMEPVDIYGESKKRAEKIVEYYAKKFKIKYCIFRLFNVYGYGNNTPHLIPTIIDQIKNKKTISLGNTDTKRDYIYVDSVVDAFIEVINKFNNNKIFNVGSGYANSAIDIINIIEDKIFNYNKKYINKKIVINKDRVRSADRPLLLSDISKIKKNLNWKPISLKSGLNKLIKKEGLMS